MAAAEPTNNTNPLDFPRYVRSLRPTLPESLPLFVEDELEKVSTSLQQLEEATNNFATARVEEERITRVTEDEALAARIVTVEAEFDAANSDTNARITTEEIARANADEAIASRVTTVEADFVAADAETNARVTVEELARASADEAIAAQITTVSARLEDSDSLTNARVSQEMYSRASGDEALAVRIDTVSADLIAGDAVNAAAVVTETTARVTADSALASQITSLTATVGTKNKTFFQTSAPTATAVGDIWFDTDDSNKPYRWDSTSWVLVADGRVAVTAAGLTTEQSVRASADTALSSSITTLTSTVGGHTSSISTLSSTSATHASNLTTLNARYGVALDVNGYVSGFQLNNSGTVSDFLIRADKFSITMPGESPITPFTVTGSGVQINGNLVVSGSITGTQISIGGVATTNLAADCATDMTQASSGGYTGSGSTQTVISTNVVMAEAGDIAVIVASKQGFAGDRSWNFDLYIDSTLVFSTGGTRIADSVALSGFKAVAAGTIPISVVWTGQNSGVTLDTIQAIMIRRYR